LALTGLALRPPNTGEKCFDRYRNTASGAGCRELEGARLLDHVVAISAPRFRILVALSASKASFWLTQRRWPRG